MLNEIIIIPARLNSTRLPAKMLLDDTGMPLIWHTYQAAIDSHYMVYVATESDQIKDCCVNHNMKFVITNSKHRSGTDRVAEAVNILFTPENQPEIVVNLQGDHPEVEPQHIKSLIKILNKYSNIFCATLASPITSKDARDPNRVKVAFNYHNQAVYFSRQPISCGEKRYYQHVGVYAYRRSVLRNFTKWEVSDLEKSEDLEQMRLVDHSQYIHVEVIDEVVPSIDTASDYQDFVKRMTKCAYW